MIQARKLKGFCDFNPDAARRRDEIVSSLRGNARIAGFEEISTPCLEYSEVLLGSAGGETEKEVYRFEDHGGRSVALRFDLTVPFARYVAENQGTLIMPFKKFQVGEVWRGEKPQKGRYRQFCQADVDIIGSDEISADLEVLQLIVKTIDGLLRKPFTIQLGNRVILTSLIRHAFAGITEDQEKKVFVAIDKLEKIGLDKVCGLIQKDCGFEGADIKNLIGKISDQKTYSSFTQDIPGVADEMMRFEKTISLLTKLTQRMAVTVKPNLSIARGLGYYTGIVFETTIDELPGFGSISSGGRYNELVSRFSKQEYPGVGGSIGVDRLLAAFDEFADPASEQRAGVFIAISDPAALELAFEVAEDIREAGKLCEVATKASKLAQQFKYADRRKRLHVVVLGTDELETGSFTLKNLETGLEEKGIKDIRELIQRI